MKTIRGVCALCRLAKRPTAKCKHPARVPVHVGLRGNTRMLAEYLKRLILAHPVECGPVRIVERDGYLEVSWLA